MMKLNRRLSPSLAEVERRLFGVSDALMAAVERDETSPAIAESVRRSPEWAERSEGPPSPSESIDAGDVPPGRTPDWILELILRRVRAVEAFGQERPAAPEPGQIVEVSEIRTPRRGQLDWIMQVPLYVLIDAVAEDAALWHGWLVSSEVDYASWWDFVLQEPDAPFDPEAAVVQLWNPVRIYWPMAGRVAGRLSPARLQAVRALAAEYLTGELPADTPVWPGRVAERKTFGGLPVTTGSPLGRNDDPRHRYQHLYFNAGEAIRQPARLALAALAEQHAYHRLKALFDRLLGKAVKFGQTMVAVPKSSAIKHSGDSPTILDSFVRDMAHRPLGSLGSGADRVVSLAKRVGSPVIGVGLAADVSGSLIGIGKFLFGMPSDPLTEDLQWSDLVRISLMESRSDGSGKMELAIIGTQPVTCALLIAGVPEGGTTLQPGESGFPVEWRGGTSTALVLVAADGQRLELPLIENLSSDANSLAEAALGQVEPPTSVGASQFPPIDRDAIRNHIKALGRGTVAPADARERHFLKVLAGEARPSSPSERAWFEYWRTHSDDAVD